MAEYVNAGKLSDFEDGLIHAIEAEGQYYAIVKVGDRLHAFSNVCPHAGFPISGGAVSRTEIMCFAHGAVFELETGAYVDGPNSGDLPCFEVKIEGDDVLVAKM